MRRELPLAAMLLVAIWALPIRSNESSEAAQPSQASGQAERPNRWPQFRGPGARGVGEGTNLPDRWSAKENVAWKRDIPGRGWSSPVVWASHVFLTTVCRLRPPVSAGEWRPWENSQRMATPAVVGDKLLIRTSARLYCVRKAADAR
ncbi:MAG TPA: PQQ-binding-like beta-propeller repeat protein [Pirellulales bacterium]